MFYWLIFCRPIFRRAIFYGAIEICGQRLSGVGLLHARDLLGRALRDDTATFFSAFGAKIQNPVGIADHIQIVFDDDDRISKIGQAMQHVQQFAHVVKVQSCGRLIQQIQSFSSLTFAEFTRQFDALRFSPESVTAD